MKSLVMNMLMQCAPFIRIFAEDELLRNERSLHPTSKLCQGLPEINVTVRYNQAMIRTWKVTKNKAEEIHFPDSASLDAVTRQLPDGYYSTFRTYGGCTHVLGLTAHLHRLPDVDASLLRRNLNQLLEPYRPPFGPRARRGETADEARVRVIQTKQGQIYFAIEPLKPLPREVYEKGVRVETAEIQRNSPRVKSTAFIGQSDDERKHIAQLGIFEALLVKNGKILEGMTSNFFYVLGSYAERASTSHVAKNAPHSAHEVPMHFRERGILYTAQRGILLGVTRRTVIRVARGRGVDVRYSPLKLDQLPAVSEAFITSSSRGIVPVIQIDDVKVGEGRVGKITQILMAAYEENVLKLAERI
jgi:branched-chain amino acid aminotransferase